MKLHKIKKNQVTSIYTKQNHMQFKNSPQTTTHHQEQPGKQNNQQTTKHNNNNTPKYHNSPGKHKHVTRS